MYPITEALEQTGGGRLRTHTEANIPAFNRTDTAANDLSWARAKSDITWKAEV